MLQSYFKSDSSFLEHSKTAKKNTFFHLFLITAISEGAVSPRPAPWEARYSGTSFSPPATRAGAKVIFILQIHKGLGDLGRTSS